LADADRRILIAEDDDTSRLILQTTLRKLGYEVTATRDGREAWEALQHSRPCPIVITDWLMPGMDGLDLCRKIRARPLQPAYTYVLILTSLTGTDSYLDGMTAGADDFMSKPFDGDDLVARLRIAERILGLEAGIAHLEGFLHTCAACRRVRNDGGAWTTLDRYLVEQARTPRAPQHCPRCAPDGHGLTAPTTTGSDAHEPPPHRRRRVLHGRRR
jgi:CheY-like chemotaxis protein